MKLTMIVFLIGDEPSTKFWIRNTVNLWQLKLENKRLFFFLISEQVFSFLV